MIDWATNFLPYSIPIISVLLGLGITWFVLPIIITISHEKQLVDEPVVARKLHTSYTPNLGGVAFYFSLLTVFLFSGFAYQSWTPPLLGGLTLIFFCGLKDDIKVLSPKTKLFIQVLAVLALIVGGKLVITDLGGVFGVNEIPYFAGVLLTSFTMIVVINAYNLIDGIDGLAGTVGIIASLFFGGWFWYTGYMGQAILAFACAGTLAGFLRYNFQPASIFMGDTGSHVIGYLLAFLAVSFVDLGVSADAIVPFQSSVPVLVLAVLIVPLYDTLRVFIIRSFKSGSPFKADRLHVHHQLLDLGFSHATTCYIIGVLNLGVIALTLLLDGLNVNMLFLVVLGVCAILFPTAGLKRGIYSRLGWELPTPRHINILEKRYGLSARTVGKKKNKKIPHKEDREEQEWEKVAV